MGHSLWVEGKARCWDVSGSHCIQSQEAEMDAGAQLASSFISQDSSPWNDTTHSGWIFSHRLTLEDPHSHAQRSVSWVALDPVKVTISIFIQTKPQLIDRVLSLYRSKTLHRDGHGTGCPRTQCHFRRRTNEQNSKITPC